MSEIKRAKLAGFTVKVGGQSWVITDGQMIQVHRDVRLYYMPHAEREDVPGKHYGFTFCAVQWCGGDGFGDERDGNTSDIWAYPNPLIEVWFQGVAYFDGLRHLWMGDERTDSEGYLNYADTRILAAVFVELDKLEQRLLEPEYHHRA